MGYCGYKAAVPIHTKHAKFVSLLVHKWHK